MKKLAWHYTTGQKFAKIVETGRLLPTAVHIAKDEKPIIWFSLEQFWEPTAHKAIRQNGQIIDLDMEGTYRECCGLVRFGVSHSRLIPWPRLAKVANIPAGIRRALASVGQRQGAIPEQWCGIVGAELRLEAVEAIEVFDGEKWERVQ